MPNAAALFNEAYIAVLKLCGDDDAGTIANRQMLRKFRDANDSAAAAWFSTGPLRPAKMKSVTMLATLDMTDDALFQRTKNLFYKLQYPEVAGSDLSLDVLVKWGTIQSIKAQRVHQAHRLPP